MTTDAPAATAMPDERELDDAPLADPYYAASRRRQWVMVVCLTVMSMLAMIDKFIFALLVNPIREHFNFTDTQISLLLGLAFAAANLSISLPAGYLADRFSRRGLVAAGAVMWSLMAASCGLAANYWQLFAARAAVGLGEGLIPPPSFSLIRDAVAPERRGLALSVYAMATMAGTAVALIVGGILIGVITRSGVSSLPFLGPLEPWQLTFLAVGVGGLPLVLLMALVREPVRPATAPGQAPQRTASMADAWRHVAQHGSVYGPLFVFATSNMLIGQSFGAWVPAMLGRDWGLPPQVVGPRFGMLMIVLAPLGLWIAGVVLDRIRGMGRRGAVLVGTVATLAMWGCAVVMPLSPNQAVLWLMLGLLLFTSAAHAPVTPIVVNMTAPAGLTGRVMGLQLLVQGLFAVALAPTVTALVSDHIYGGGPGSLGYALSTISAVCGGISMIALLLLLRRVQRDR